MPCIAFSCDLTLLLQCIAAPCIYIWHHGMHCMMALLAGLQYMVHYIPICNMALPCIALWWPHIALWHYGLYCIARLVLNCVTVLLPVVYSVIHSSALWLALHCIVLACVTPLLHAVYSVTSSSCCALYCM